MAGPDTYEGPGSARQLLARTVERPILPTAKLFTNRTFLSLVWDEWRSSLSKDEMCRRVRRFVPSLETGMPTSLGLAGVRSSLLDRDGFVPEAVILEDSRSLLVLDYNSPLATGAPVFSAYLARKLEQDGALDPLRRKPRMKLVWDFEETRIDEGVAPTGKEAGVAGS